MDDASAPQYPLQPLVDLWVKRNPPHLSSNCTCTIVDPETGEPEGFCASIESLARKVGVSHSTIHRRRREGFICEEEADQWAASVGVGAATLWCDLWDRILEAEGSAVECHVIDERRPRVCAGDWLDVVA